jgi:hypothetical protein
MSASILAITDIIEDAIMHREVCPHQGAAAYKRVVDVNALLKEGTLSLDEARHHALHDLKRALETPRFPDAAAKSLYRSIALEDRRHA